jgi:hypothetical protein
MWKKAVVAQFELALLSKHFTGLTERNKENSPKVESFFGPRFEPITLRVQSWSTACSTKTLAIPTSIDLLQHSK